MPLRFHAKIKLKQALENAYAQEKGSRGRFTTSAKQIVEEGEESNADDEDDYE
jgi:hypothetical protein